MGANGSYDKKLGGVPKDKRTHLDTGYRIQGHKVLLQLDTYSQTSNILNSNSDSPVYLIAKMYEDGSIAVLNVNVNKDHQIQMDINIKFDKHGNIIPYNGKEAATHAHHWIKLPNGNMSRKPVPQGENPHIPVPQEYSSLLSDIKKFNLQKHKLKNGKHNS